MLVLSRQKNESIIIGDNIEIVIVDVRGDKIRLGITAPKNISVHRKEVYEEIQREKTGEKKKDSSQKPPVKKSLDDEPDDVDEGLRHKKRDFRDSEDLGSEQEDKLQK